MAKSEWVIVTDAAGIERCVRPVDAKEIIEHGGKGGAGASVDVAVAEMIIAVDDGETVVEDIAEVPGEFHPVTIHNLEDKPKATRAKKAK